jgi:carbonic anhydrase
MVTFTKENLNNLSPEQAIMLLQDGNKRFVRNLKINRNLLQQVNETSDGQYPFAAILSCIDSRTSAELIFDQGLGDVFSIRIAGNVLNEDVLGSLEFATKVSGSRVIVVLGHTKCGAIQGACNNVQLGNLTGLLNKIKPAIEKEDQIKVNRNGQNPEFVDRVGHVNVELTISEMLKQSPIIYEMYKDKSIAIIGGMYDIETGVVSFLQIHSDAINIKVASTTGELS